MDIIHMTGREVLTWPSVDTMLTSERRQWSARWPNFTPEELACKGTGRVFVDVEALNALQKLRTTVGQPFFITSAYRSWAHQVAIYEKLGREPGKRSLHLVGRAFDIEAHTEWLKSTILLFARSCGFRRAGVSIDFVHLDDGTPEEGYIVPLWTY